MDPQPAVASKPTRWICLAAVALVASNLVPLAGVLHLGWSLGTVMLLFWMDNVAIGLFTMARIRLTPLDRTAYGARLCA